MKISGNTSPTVNKDRTPDAKDVRAALQRLVKSSTFAGSQRLQDFLIYVVEESLRGRADDIRAKTIAMDVYGGTMSEMARRENVVRVDAGRLRRKLSEYYADAGRNEDTLFDLPKGGYAPQITVRAPSAGMSDSPVAPHIKARAWRIGAAGIVVLVGFATVLMLTSPKRDAPGQSMVDGLSPDERSAIFDASPMRLEAVNLANSGRDLIFPALEPARLNAALIMFEGAIKNDPSYFGGYAGAAQVAATMAVVTPDPDLTRDMLAYADSQALMALEQAPETGWSQAAKAWVEFAKGNWPEANEFAERARRLAPNDVHVLEFVSLILLYSGSFEHVVSISKEALSKIDLERGYVFQNAMGSAKFHLKDYKGTVSTFEHVAEKGGPVGPVSVAYLMAAHQMLGNVAEAQTLSKKLSREWPESRVDLLFQRLFADPKHGEELGRAMKDAGWEPKG
ncbi:MULTISPECIES: adenylate cyclase [unclassified Ruegeria]|uniref:adenylate cyclase n=1 Tax=unclassified Ruegeria TaxID=2625375 RepID=UPI001ADD038B|nr:MULTISPECIES: adenylate cyclase [unclassified Ruegeria]MBO9411750.1 adenylate cyclase [Ruegeria sp. R8_1]MBO9415688.1 adenylate cyclase [Ruegeria sp. R8_2]